MKKAYGNRGITLVELLVVVAILSVVVGGTGISIALAYSRDAEKCAKSINAAIENTRMLSMSQKGTFEMTLDMEQNTITINNTVKNDDGTSAESEYSSENLQNRVKIYVPGDDSIKSIKVRFDKSSGKVVEMTGDTDDDGVLTITSENNNGKKASVVLVKNTGKHYVSYN